MAIVPVPLANIRAMAPVIGFHKLDMGIGGDSAARFRQDANDQHYKSPYWLIIDYYLFLFVRVVDGPRKFLGIDG